jgi:hypothetical protein
MRKLDRSRNEASEDPELQSILRVYWVCHQLEK